MNKPGDIVRVRNNAGILNVELVRRLKLTDVMTCRGGDALPSLCRPRLEFHTGNYGEFVVTLCDADESEFPMTMYLAFWDADICASAPEIWEGQINSSETPDDFYRTVQEAPVNT